MAELVDEEAAVPPKQDPETLVLRGSPRPVVRFRRGLIIGITGAVAASLVTVTWVALKPPNFHLAAGEDSGSQTAAKPAPDPLANAPASYGDVPRLGPPLPGDLGRPILEHQRGLEAPSPAVAMPSAGASEAERARTAALTERQRLEAAKIAARASGIIVQLGGARNAGQSTADLAQRQEAQVEVGAAAPADAGRPTEQDRKAEFRSQPGDTNAYPLRPAASAWTLSAGTIIPASLITGLNSDLPGTVIAQVTENVRDSATGRTVLVPQGARLIGSYDSSVSYGQRRALLVWQRIVFPDGSSVRLDNAPATDAAGYSGVADGVDSHTWRLLKGIALSTLLGVGTQLTFGSKEADLVRAIRESAQQNAARAGDQITSRNLSVQPTLTVRPGWPVRAVIHKDLVIRPWRA